MLSFIRLTTFHLLCIWAWAGDRRLCWRARAGLRKFFISSLLSVFGQLVGRSMHLTMESRRVRQSNGSRVRLHWWHPWTSALWQRKMPLFTAQNWSKLNILTNVFTAAHNTISNEQIEGKPIFWMKVLLPPLHVFFYLIRAHGAKRFKGLIEAYRGKIIQKHATALPLRNQHWPMNDGIWENQFLHRLGT